MILKYKILPNTMLNQFLEFTPIDLCAKAINLLIYNLNSSKYVFHLFNQNYLPAQTLLNILKEHGIDISILSGNNFKTQILALSKANPEENIPNPSSLSGGEIAAIVISCIIFNNQPRLFSQRRI